MNNNKSQIGNLQGIVLALVIIGVLLGSAFLLLAEFKDSTDQISVRINNETGAFFNATGYNVSTSDAPGFSNFAVVIAINGSSGLVIAPGNYSVNSNTGIVTNATARVWQSVNLTYNFHTDSESQKGVGMTILAMKKIPQLLGLIVLIAVVAVIIALIFGAFPGNRSGT